MKYANLKRYAATFGVEYNDDAPHGCSGSYYRLPHGVGVKVYYNSSFNSTHDCIGSDTWWQASWALHALRKAASSGVSPKPYCVAPVLMDGVYYVGLFMEHIDGWCSWSRKHEAAHRKLEKLGVVVRDRGEHNAMVTKDGKPIIVDFDWAEVNGRDPCGW